MMALSFTFGCITGSGFPRKPFAQLNHVATSTEIGFLGETLVLIFPAGKSPEFIVDLATRSPVQPGPDAEVRQGLLLKPGYSEWLTASGGFGLSPLVATGSGPADRRSGGILQKAGFLISSLVGMNPGKLVGFQLAYGKHAETTEQVLKEESGLDAITALHLGYNLNLIAAEVAKSGQDEYRQELEALLTGNFRDPDADAESARLRYQRAAVTLILKARKDGLLQPPPSKQIGIVLFFFVLPGMAAMTAVLAMRSRES